MRAREAGVGRAEICVEVAAAPALPLEAEQREERLAERRLAEADPTLDGERDSGRAEHRLERRPPALERREDESDLLERDAGGSELTDLLRDELQRAAGAGALEEADRARERGPRRRRVGEEMPLEMSERSGTVTGGRGGELGDPATRERGQVLLRAPQRGESRAAGLVRERDGHLRAGRKGLEQPPLRPGQVLEPVGEDGPPVPGAELGLQPFDSVPPEQVAVPQAQAVELGPVGAVERRELAL